MKAHIGNHVKVRYKGRLSDGTPFASTPQDHPLEFDLGKHEVIHGFEQALVGMGEGETKTIIVPADDAFGPHRDELVITLNRDKLPPNVDPHVGQRLQVRMGGGDGVEVRIVGMDAETVTLDANHPLSGEQLVFDIKLLEVTH